MIKIDKQDYVNFYDIFNELSSYTFLFGALDGIVRGELYADNTNNPTFAMMLTADCYYIVGDLSDEQLGKEIFGKHTYEFVERKSYQMLKSEYKYINDTIDGIDKINLTPNNIAKFKKLGNFKAVYEDSKYYWDEYPKSSRINFCIALVKDNTILTRCFLCGESSFENSCEPDIETYEGFKEKGYAETVCREVIKEVIKLGYDKINWHCHTRSIASNKTALKLGFKLVDENHLAWFRKILDTN